MIIKLTENSQNVTLIFSSGFGPSLCNKCVNNVIHFQNYVTFYAIKQLNFIR
jgi:hypothetical protein